MKINANTETFEMVTVFGAPMLFTCARVDKATVPERLFCYEVRHDDDGQGIPCEIASWVMVNHWGTLISLSKLDLIENPSHTNAYLELTEDDWNYEGYCISLSEYIEEYSKSVIEDGEDLFYTDEERDFIKWVYFNPDSVAGGQYVVNLFDKELLKEAVKKYGEDTEKVFDMVGELCRQYLMDIGTELFPSYSKELLAHNPISKGLCKETISVLLKDGDFGGK